MDRIERNAAISAKIKRHTAALIADPVKLAAWAATARREADEFDAYMALETHAPECHCSRCMSDFLRRNEPR